MQSTISQLYINKTRESDWQYGEVNKLTVQSQFPPYPPPPLSFQLQKRLLCNKYNIK